MARAQGIVVGLGASWIKALTEPRHQSVAERILPSAPAQRQELALGHGGLNARQRLRVREPIHHGFGAGLGVARPGAAKRWRVVSRGRGALAGLATDASTRASVLPALGIRRPPWRLTPTERISGQTIIRICP